MTSPLDHFLDTIDPKAARLIGEPDKIWVAGGNHTAHHPSLKDSFIKQCQSPRMKGVWLNYITPIDKFFTQDNPIPRKENLESYLNICRSGIATILFAESPEAYAQLGVLLLDHDLPKKSLIIFPKHRHNPNEIYNIQKSLDQNMIIETNNTTEITDQDFSNISSSIQNILKTKLRSTRFRTSKPHHILLLLTDLVDLFLVITPPELRQLMAFFGVPIDQTQFSKAMALLSKLGFVSFAKYGHQSFWIRTRQTNTPWFNYQSRKDAVPFDRSRFKTRFSLPQIQEHPHLNKMYRHEFDI